MFRTVASLVAVAQGIKIQARCNYQTKNKLGGGEVKVIDGKCVNVGNDKADFIESTPLQFSFAVASAGALRAPQG